MSARLAFSAGVVLFIFIILTGIALDRAFVDSARSAVRDRQLGLIYLLLAAAEADAQGQISMPETLAEARFNVPGSGLYAQITGNDGEVSWRSPSMLGREFLFPKMLPPGEHRFQQVTTDQDGDFFVSSFGVAWATEAGEHLFTFHVAEDMTAFRAQISEYRRSLWRWFGAMSLLLLLTLTVVLRWVLAPLRRVTTELTLIESGNQEEIKGTYPRELQKLIDNLNALMRHERAQVIRYRNALADLAHSLKTPLAVMRGMTSEHRRAQPKFIKDLEDQLNRMDRIVSYQLQRAATAGSSGLIKPVAVRPVARKIISTLEKVHHEKPVKVRLEVPSELCFHGDEGDLFELMGNLLENAFKWCRSQVRISVRKKEKEFMLIVVDDDGPGIDAEKVEMILHRGFRADENVPGHGIGLAIVRDIIDAYDGDIRIERSPLGGARLILELPTCQLRINNFTAQSDN
jgi:two-component system sensor histidine kinase PhoQ